MFQPFNEVCYFWGMEMKWVEKEQARIEQQLSNWLNDGERICMSSSFQTHSIPLLHLISTVAPKVDVLFLNTGYHFPETLEFRDQICNQLGVEPILVESFISKNFQRGQSGLLPFAEDPDRCCFLNKTQPMKEAMTGYDIWISGIRRDQNANRREMPELITTPDGKLRYHPILEWNSKMIHEYRKAFDLPTHPLEAKGYLSIGCEPCTQKFDLENNRDGRWQGMKKSECGLHTDLVSK